MPPVLTRPDDPSAPHQTGRTRPEGPALPQQDRMSGLPLGTEVCTAEGILPVEWLTTGDRVIARSGMCRVLSIRTWLHHGPLVRIAPGAFGTAKPARALLLPPEQRIYLGAGQSMPLSALMHGPGLSVEAVADVRLIRLIFARPEIVTTGGVQLCCGTAEAA